MTTLSYTHLRATRSIRSIIFVLSVLLWLISLQFVLHNKAHAAYEHGRLIDNTVFLDAKSMNATQIQSFLNGKTGVLKNRSFKLDCDAPGIGGTAKQLYINAGAPCGSTIPASQIIYYSAQIYGVNPKVIIATLQKEQGLITNPNAGSWEINQAMGYNCETSGSCDDESGFFWQIDNGAWILRYSYERARKNNSWWDNRSWTCGTAKTNYYSPNLYPGQNVKFYDPITKVHYVTIHIKNAATSSLYCYTPHVFNNFLGCKPAYGVSYASWKPTMGNKGSCYSGSHNFVTAYEQWFGPTANRYTPLDTPRWMETASQVYKKDPHSGENIDTPLPKGMEIRFVDKILVGGKWYLRSEYDSRHNFEKGILFSDLNELSPNYVPLDTPRWMEIKSPYPKIYLASGTKTGPTLASGTRLFIASKTMVGGEWFVRTAYDTDHNWNTVIPLDNVQDFNLSFVRLDKPRKLRTLDATYVVNPRTNERAEHLAKNYDSFYDTKTYIGDTWYLRRSSDTEGNLDRGVPITELTESPVAFMPLDEPRWMRVSINSAKLHPVSGERYEAINKNTLLFMTTKALHDGKWYLRSAYDSIHGLDKALMMDHTSTPLYVPLDTPRHLRINKATTKFNPLTRNPVDAELAPGTSLRFTTKIYLDGIWYLRTESDSRNGRHKGIKINDLDI